MEEEVKEKVINEFLNTRKQIRIIAKENNLSIEEVYAILEEYNETKKIQRPAVNLSFPSKEKEKEEDEKLIKIYDLRKEKNSYKIISEQLGIGYNSVRRLCKEVFEERNEEEPKGYSRNFFSDETKKIYEKIYQLRKKGKSFETISEETGISLYGIRLICEKIFTEKEEKIPKAVQHYQTEESKKIDDMIYYLVQEGKKYREVQEELSIIGITMSDERIRQRYKRKILQNQKDLAKMILNLTITRKATMEQIQQIADYYGVDLEETLNSLEER